MIPSQASQGAMIRPITATIAPPAINGRPAGWGGDRTSFSDSARAMTILRSGGDVYGSFTFGGQESFTLPGTGATNVFRRAIVPGPIPGRE
jgi:hypothetical protein